MGDGGGIGMSGGLKIRALACVFHARLSEATNDLNPLVQSLLVRNSTNKIEQRISDSG